MVTVKEAVAAAVAAANEFYSGEGIAGLMLEEVETSEDKQIWLITLSFLVPDPTPVAGIGAIGEMLEGMRKYERKFKVFSVNASSGFVTAMKVRKI